MSKKIFNEKPVIYADGKHMIALFDSLNWAVVDQKKAGKNFYKATVGFYSDLKGAVLEVAKSWADEKIVEKTSIEGPFREIDSLLSEYCQTLLKKAKSILGTIDLEALQIVADG